MQAPLSTPIRKSFERIESSMLGTGAPPLIDKGTYNSDMGLWRSTVF
jgi:hypothetical protein